MPAKKNTKGEVVVKELEPFASQLGKVPDAKIADMAGVTEAEVAAARGANVPDVVTRQPRAPAPPDLDDDEDSEEDNGPGPARSSDVEAALRKLYADGYRLVGDTLVPPVGRKAPELKIKLRERFTYWGKNGKGQPVSLALARSIYRGKMAETVIGIVQANAVAQGKDPDLLIEYQ